MHKQIGVKAIPVNNTKDAIEKAILLAQKLNFFPKNILFFAAVHGDEKIGINVMNKLEKNLILKISWLIANEKANEKGVRFIDVDLNRAAPGIKKAKQYEFRRAKELIEIAKNFKYIIDLHGTKANSGIFTIITNPKIENLLLASALPIKNIVIWNSDKIKEFGPITRFVNCGIEIECGPKDSAIIEKQLFEIIKKILQEGPNIDKKKLDSKQYFRVFGKVKKNEIKSNVLKKIKDFQQIKLNNETFYPLLVGEYEDVVCYKMEKIDLLNNLFNFCPLEEKDNGN